MARIFEQEQAQQFGNPVSVVCSLPPAAQALPGFAAFAGGPRVTVEATPCSVPDAVTGAARPAMLLVCRASLLSAGAAAHPPPHINGTAPHLTSVGAAAPFPAGAVAAAVAAAAAAAAAVDADTGALTPAAQRQRDSMVAAHLPAIITVFATDGRVLHQNPASEVYMGGIIPPTARPYTPQPPPPPPAAPPQVHPFSMPPLKDAGAGAGAQALTWSPGVYNNRAMAAASLGVEPTAQAAAAAGDGASPRGAATTGGRSGNRPLSKAVAVAKAAALAGGGLPRAASSSALGFASGGSRQQQLLQQQPQQIKSMDWAAAPVATRALASPSAAAAGGSDTTGAAAGAAGVAASGGRGGGGGEEVWFGHGVLGLLFKYEPAKLQQLLEVLLGRGSVWQGILRVPNTATIMQHMQPPPAAAAASPAATASYPGAALTNAGPLSPTAAAAAAGAAVVISAAAAAASAGAAANGAAPSGSQPRNPSGMTAATNAASGTGSGCLTSLVNSPHHPHHHQQQQQQQQHAGGAGVGSTASGGAGVGVSAGAGGGVAAATADANSSPPGSQAVSSGTRGKFRALRSGGSSSALQQLRSVLSGRRAGSGGDNGGSGGGGGGGGGTRGSMEAAPFPVAVSPALQAADVPTLDEAGLPEPTAHPHHHHQLQQQQQQQHPTLQLTAGGSGVAGRGVAEAEAPQLGGTFSAASAGPASGSVGPGPLLPGAGGSRGALLQSGGAGSGTGSGVGMGMGRVIGTGPPGGAATAGGYAHPPSMTLDGDADPLATSTWTIIADRTSKPHLQHMASLRSLGAAGLSIGPGGAPMMPGAAGGGGGGGGGGVLSGMGMGVVGRNRTKRMSTHTGTGSAAAAGEELAALGLARRWGSATALAPPDLGSVAEMRKSRSHEDAANPNCSLAGGLISANGGWGGGGGGGGAAPVVHAAPGASGAVDGKVAAAAPAADAGALANTAGVAVGGGATGGGGGYGGGGMAPPASTPRASSQTRRMTHLQASGSGVMNASAGAVGAAAGGGDAGGAGSGMGTGGGGPVSRVLLFASTLKSAPFPTSQGNSAGKELPAAAATAAAQPATSAAAPLATREVAAVRGDQASASPRESLAADATPGATVPALDAAAAAAARERTLRVGLAAAAAEEAAAAAHGSLVDAEPYAEAVQGYHGRRRVPLAEGAAPWAQRAALPPPPPSPSQDAQQQQQQQQQPGPRQPSSPAQHAQPPEPPAAALSPVAAASGPAAAGDPSAGALAWTSGGPGAADTSGAVVVAAAAAAAAAAALPPPDVWHEVSAVSAVDPVTGDPVIVLTQVDVTAKVRAERHLVHVMCAERRLLLQLFPRHVLQHVVEVNPLLHSGDAGLEALPKEWLDGGDWRPVLRDCDKLATMHPQATVLFADIAGFDDICMELPPQQVLAFLNDLFAKFDNSIEPFGVHKMETIGGLFIVAGGLLREEEDGAVAVRERWDPLHAEKVFMFAKSMLAVAARTKLPVGDERVKLRIGIHTGPVMSGIVGTRVPRFVLFGDTVNTASRMQTTCTPGTVHVSEDTRALLPHGNDNWTASGGVMIKGKGLLNTYVWTPEDLPHYLLPPPGSARSGFTTTTSQSSPGGTATAAVVALRAGAAAAVAAAANDNVVNGTCSNHAADGHSPQDNTNTNADAAAAAGRPTPGRSRNAAGAGARDGAGADLMGSCENAAGLSEEDAQASAAAAIAALAEASRTDSSGMGGYGDAGDSGAGGAGGAGGGSRHTGGGGRARLAAAVAARASQAAPAGAGAGAGAALLNSTMDSSSVTSSDMQLAQQLSFTSNVLATRVRSRLRHEGYL